MLTLLNPTKTEDQSGYIVKSLTCPNCDTDTRTYVTKQEMYDYNQGGLAQDVLKELPREERERYITGICSPCWDTMFPEEGDSNVTNN